MDYFDKKCKLCGYTLDDKRIGVVLCKKVTKHNVVCCENCESLNRCWKCLKICCPTCLNLNFCKKCWVVVCDECCMRCKLCSLIICHIENCPNNLQENHYAECDICHKVGCDNILTVCNRCLATVCRSCIAISVGRNEDICLTCRSQQSMKKLKTGH